MLTLTAKTFSKAAKLEIKTHFPTATAFRKRHVPAIGYVYFIKNIKGETIAKCYKLNGYMVCEGTK